MTDPYTVVSTSNTAMVDYPLWMQAGGTDAPLAYSAQDFRRLTDQWQPHEGVISGFLVGTLATPGMWVSVASGVGIVSTTTTAGKYAVTTTSSVTVNVPSAVGGTYLHRLVAEILDAQALGSSGYGWQLRLVQGSSPGVLPAEPANSISLAKIQVAVGQTSIAATDITDLRWPAGDALTAVLSANADHSVTSGSATSLAFDTADYDPWNVWDDASPQQVRLRTGMGGIYDFTVTGWVKGTAAALSNKRFTVRLGVGGQPNLDDDVGVTTSYTAGFRADRDTGTLTQDGIALPLLVANGVRVPTSISSSGLIVRPYITPSATVTVSRLRMTVQRRKYA